MTMLRKKKNKRVSKTPKDKRGCKPKDIKIPVKKIPLEDLQELARVWDEYLCE